MYLPAQRAELMLSDGTKVWLNSLSTLTFPGHFNGDIRNVKLDGEGYFAVTKNAKQPFIVETNKCNVKVLGTEFNVMAYATDNIWGNGLTGRNSRNLKSWYYNERDEVGAQYNGKSERK